MHRVLWILVSSRSIFHIGFPDGLKSLLSKYLPDRLFSEDFGNLKERILGAVDFGGRDSHILLLHVVLKAPLCLAEKA